MSSFFARPPWRFTPPGLTPLRPIAKYSAEWKGHGHGVIKAVIRVAILRSLNACHLIEFLRFSRAPHRRPLCYIPPAHYIGGTGRGHCDPSFTRRTLGGFSRDMTFSIPRSLPTEQASQVFPPSPSLILSICTARPARFMGEAAHEHRSQEVGLQGSSTVHWVFLFLCRFCTFLPRRRLFNPPCAAN